MHLYIITKAKTAFNFKSRTVTLLILFSVIMVFSPIIIRLSSFPDLHLAAQKLTYTFFLWMALVFLLSCLLITIDFCRLFSKALKRFLRLDLSRFIPSSRFLFITSFSLAIMLVVYGSFEAKDIRTEKVTISSSKLPESMDKLTIVHVSDVHLGLIIREKRLEKIIELIKQAKPDILMATGDIVDGQINHHLKLIEPFREITPRYGKYAIAGNHEFYVGIEQAVDFMEKAGFIMLRGRGVTVEGLINVAGVDDPAAKNFSDARIATEREVLSALPRDKFTIFLKHRPDIKADYIGLFDLQLSGHSHKGQIFPFSIATKLYYEVHAGLAKVSNDSYLYVSRGAGTSGPPIRILSPPEITVIEVLRKP